MGSYLSRQNIPEESKPYNKNYTYYYTPYKSEHIDPVSLVLKYIKKEHVIEVASDSASKLFIEGKNGNSITGFLPIIKYMGRTNFLYPNLNYLDCALIDYWIERFLKVKTILNLYKNGTITGKEYFILVRKEFDFFSECYTGSLSLYIESFDSPTVADFCWYSFFYYCENDIDHKVLLNDYKDIIKYK
jgi:hypothetical protein